ncbi:outer membrane transport energization protein TonB [Luteibacter rhizovicinus]|uniref:Outer membrane transport energization protein TonB n=2 Tax=Luteibacter rhizovicinus TaxID=242606 RepID=A0A4R3YTN2_9GAMM|nr:outer membrane transport energization protein TonB [Luteibacter rhizovicinus]
MLLAGLAVAAGPGAIRKQIEASMLVTGAIDVAPDGTVSKYVLDRPDRLSPEVVTLIQRSAAIWRFKPVLADGKAVPAHASMSLRLVASRQDDGNYVARVKGAHFGDDVPGETISQKQQRPPEYPRSAIQAGVAASVYLLIHVGRDGRVTDADAEQVNLQAVASDADMRAWRKLFANVSKQAVRDWTFNLPTQGPHVADAGWVARVPIQFRLRKNGVIEDDYGVWQAYVPGPKEAVVWMGPTGGPEDEKNGVADALPDGGVYLVGSGLTLITPLDRS